LSLQPVGWGDALATKFRLFLQEFDLIIKPLTTVCRHRGRLGRVVTSLDDKCPLTLALSPRSWAHLPGHVMSKTVPGKTSSIHLLITLKPFLTEASKEVHILLLLLRFKRTFPIDRRDVINGNNQI